MHGLPLELWSWIFSYACTDDGRTGRSLSLVCTCFHEASKSSKLQSLTIIGHQQIIASAKMLVSTIPRYRRVHNLFISTHSPSKKRQRKLAVNEDEKSATCEAITRILTAVAPQIQTLHVVFAFHRDFFFLPVHLPVLVELTLQGPFLSFPTFSSPLSATVRKLSVLDVPFDFSAPSLTAYAAYVPHATHLRIAAQGTLGKEFIHCLRDALCADKPQGTPSTVFPKSLVKLHFHLPKEHQAMSFEGRNFSLEQELLRLTKIDSRLVLQETYDCHSRSAWGHEEGLAEWLRNASGIDLWKVLPSHRLPKKDKPTVSGPRRYIDAVW
ncbi:hypothetical protein BDN72DRAFT_426767 [Pluteus cervinus]|uniref:Uncharacterized protein n=1 Tax=Pluteus cervinus TaxID=181527 RepID=A0ACD3B0N3_9AGAR|nr:hypothetical protein BDN72DRAFT_426767 [Pluteus cervinus]